jgi:hypothetical protein
MSKIKDEYFFATHPLITIFSSFTIFLVIYALLLMILQNDSWIFGVSIFTTVAIYVVSYNISNDVNWNLTFVGCILIGFIAGLGISIASFNLGGNFTEGLKFIGLILTIGLAINDLIVYIAERINKGINIFVVLILIGIFCFYIGYTNYQNFNLPRVIELDSSIEDYIEQKIISNEIELKGFEKSSHKDLNNQYLKLKEYDTVNDAIGLALLAFAQYLLIYRILIRLGRIQIKS